MVSVLLPARHSRWQVPIYAPMRQFIPSAEDFERQQLFFKKIT
jgi:hypothetical protein